MLINFAVENFLSFEERTEFSMIPSTRVSTMPEHTVKTQNNENGLPLLKHGVIYGANASGKSNLIQGISFLQSTIRATLLPRSTTMYCKSAEENKTKNSLFEIQFQCQGRYFCYRILVLLKDKRILEEYLDEFFSDGEKKPIYHWISGEKPKIFEMPPENTKDHFKLDTYLDDFCKTGNVLFLSFMNQRKNYDETEHLQYFPLVYDWLVNRIEVCFPTTNLTKEQFSTQYSLEKINQLIPLFDTGIQEIKLDYIPLNEFYDEFPEGVGEEFIVNQLADMQDHGIHETHFMVGLNHYRLQLNDERKFKLEVGKLAHTVGTELFSFHEESDGTNRLYELLGLLLNAEEDKVYLIDELERSLHPKLTEKLLELFHDIHKNKRVQLIFTTHEATIMTLDKFRRDEIWFMEKNKKCVSNLYPLDRFKEDYDKELKDAYFEGRYGAIPVFREIF